MDLRHFKYFIAVAEEKNIGKAALRLNISQPPLTRQIQQLEHELSAQLLIRTPRGVELTQAGELFLEEARNIQSVVEQAIERTKRTNQGQLGRLDIGIFGTGVLSAIPELLNIFRASHPDVRVVLHTMNKVEQIQALRQKRISVGFNRILSAVPDIATEVIMREPLYLAVNEDHQLNENDTVSIFELSKYPLVLFPSGSRPNYVDKIMELCNNMGFMPEISQIVGDAVTGIALVAGGFGITIVPECAIALKPPGIVYLPFHDCNATIDLSCMYRKNDRSAILQAFLPSIKIFRAQKGYEAP